MAPLTPRQPPPPRQYRLRIYDGDYEVLANRVHVITLDLAGPGVDAILAERLQALTRTAMAANEPMEHPRLELWDEATGAKVRDWTGG